jgi:tripartite-type tricarboxylate transporter receptor subunit TctC
MRRRDLLAGASLVVGALSATAAKGQSWPTHPIRMIVPYAPGATGDIMGRLFGEELGKVLGQTIVIDNKTGAGGTIAMAETARAPGDGYTIAVVAQGTLVYNIGLYKTPGYDPLKDMVLMSVNIAVSNILIVHPSNPAKTVADVLAQARAKPGEFTYSSGGIGTSHHMSGVLLEMRSGVKLQHVPYRATPAGINAVATGEVAMGMFNTPTVISQIKVGKLKAIAITSPRRSELFPELPTMIESGVKDFVVDTWLGFGAPASLPPAMVARFNTELNRISQLPAMREKMVAQGIDVQTPISPEQARKFLEDDMALWLPIIKASGATAE